MKPIVKNILFIAAIAFAVYALTSRVATLRKIATGA